MPGSVTRSWRRVLLTGDRAAETEMCRRLGPRIRLYGLRHLRSAAAADDLVQQVLLRTIEALRAGRLRESNKLPPFVLGTCRMTVLDLRRSARRQEHLLQEFGGILVPEQPRAAQPRRRSTGSVCSGPQGA